MTFIGTYTTVAFPITCPSFLVTSYSFLFSHYSGASHDVSFILLSEGAESFIFSEGGGFERSHVLHTREASYGSPLKGSRVKQESVALT